MKKINCQDSLWFRAMSLKERIAVSSDELVDDVELGLKRLKRWKSDSIWVNTELFAQKLATEGINEEQFCQILGQTVVTVPLTWVKEIEQAYENFNNQDIAKLLSSSSLSAHPCFGFLNVLTPLLAQGIIKLEAGLNNIQNLPKNLNNINDILLEGLPEQLLLMVNTTLVLELNVARLQGLLTGDDSQSKFSSFIQRLKIPEVQLALWEEYPVLARQVLETINRWVENTLEFIQHFCHDWVDICYQFQPSANSEKLVKVKRGLGDSHNNGRSVIILEFATSWQLVYKPRSLAVDVHFQELLLWLNAKGFNPNFPTLKILNRNNYGWVEFVNFKECHSADELKRFYQRQGGYLGLLYSLEATDCNSQEVVNCQIGKVKMRFSAYPYPDYGILEGAVRSITADAILSQSNNTGESYFEVTIESEKLHLQRDLQKYPIQAGMEVVTEIIAKEESVLTFILRKTRLLTNL